MTRTVLDMKSAFPKALESVGKLNNKVVVVVGETSMLEVIAPLDQRVFVTKLFEYK